MSDGGFPGFGIGLTTADFQAVGKYPNIRIWLKSWMRWMRALWEIFRSIVS